jgi:hypothetical protein
MSCSRNVLFGLATLVCVFVVACGDDDDGGTDDGTEELSAYFLAVEEIRQDYQLDAQDLELELQEATSPDNDEPAQLLGLRNYLRASQDAFSAAIDQVEALDPPEEAAEAHAAFVDAGRAVVVETSAVYDELLEAQTVEAATELLTNTPEADVAAAAFRSACMDLEAIADAEGIAAGLACGEEQPTASPQ